MPKTQEEYDKEILETLEEHLKEMDPLDQNNIHYVVEEALKHEVDIEKMFQEIYPNENEEGIKTISFITKSLLEYKYNKKIS